MKIIRPSYKYVESGKLDNVLANTMHVRYLSRINEKVLPTRYNLRQPDGSIKKYTIGDNVITIQTIKKLANKYKQVALEIFGNVKHLKF